MVGRVRSPALLAIFAVALVFAAAPAAAQSKDDRERARALMDEGDAKTEAKDFAGALASYRAADAIMHVPTTTIEVARALGRLARLLEARDMATVIASSERKAGEPAPFTKAREDARSLLQELDRRLPTLRVSVVGPSSDAFDVIVDGIKLPRNTATTPRKVDPGKHSVVVASTGFTTDSRALVLAEGANAGVTVVLVAEGHTPPVNTGGDATTAVVVPSPSKPGWAGRSPLVWIGFGVAGAGVVVGTVTGIVSLTAASSAKNYCTANGACTPEAQPDIDRSKGFAVASDVAFGVAIAGAAVGVIGWYTGALMTKKTANGALLPTLTVLPALRGATIAGRF